jgi:hypothetical protein
MSTNAGLSSTLCPYMSIENPGTKSRSPDDHDQAPTEDGMGKYERGSQDNHPSISGYARTESGQPTSLSRSRPRRQKTHTIETATQ